jgi:hypothetical protein
MAETTIEGARQILADLERKLASAKAKAVDLDGRRTQISYRAHTSDAKAAAELAAMNRARAELALEIESIEAALAEAGRRVAAAERQATLKAQHDKARRVRDIAAAVAPSGARIAEAARTLRDEIKALNADLDEMRRLGAPVVNGRLVVLAMTRSILALLREAGLDIDIIPPGLRHDPQQLVDGYVASATAWATKTLDCEAAPKREAA